MKILRSSCHGVAWTAVIAMCLSPAIVVGGEGQFADETTSPRGGFIRDVALAPGGLLVGQVLDEAMQPIPGTAVEIHSQGQLAVSTTTDESGTFAVTGLRGGVHQVIARGSVENCRLWSPGTAPPHAAERLRFIPGQGEAVRGQLGMAAFASWATNPWVITGATVTAAAVSVPIILHNLDKDKDYSS